MKIKELVSRGYVFSLAEIVPDEDNAMFIRLLIYLSNVLNENQEVPVIIGLKEIKIPGYSFSKSDAYELKEWLVDKKYAKENKRAKCEFTYRIWDIFEVLAAKNAEYIRKTNFI